MDQHKRRIYKQKRAAASGNEGETAGTARRGGEDGRGPDNLSKFISDLTRLGIVI